MKKILADTFRILTKRERQLFLRLVLLDIIISILDIGFLIILLLVINFYTMPGYTAGLPAAWLSYIKAYPLSVIIVFFVSFSLKNIFGYWVFKRQFNYVYDVASRLSKKRLQEYLEGGFSDYVTIDSAVITRKVAQQPIEYCHYVLRAVQQVISQVVLILFTLIPVILFNAALFPLLLLILLPPVFLLAKLMKKRLHTIRASGKISSELSMQHLKEALAGYVESNIYGKKDFFTTRYHRFQAKLNHYLSEQQIIQNLPSRLIEVFAIFGLFILILINALTTHSSTVPIITVGAFIAAAYKIIPGIVKILNSMGQIKTYSFTVTDLLADLPTSEPLPALDETINSVTFSNVNFTYRKDPIIHNLSFAIHAGECIGITGNSGKGKTSIVNLLLGFMEPVSGTITFNGLAAPAKRRQQYWNRIAYIKQQSFLIHDSICRNITLTEDEFDQGKLSEVLAITGLEELAASLPDGIHTIITEEGKNISGGQRQRIIMARALYKDFDLLIADEPFNELDAAAETALLMHLKKLADSGKAVILITHNNEALSFCNKTITLT